nr:MAG TPA: hypothetical protein [Caudoviricetes sp.]
MTRTTYNYNEAVKNDVLDYIRNEVNFSEFEDMEELEQSLNDDLWTVDSVTGNASGSYTFNRYQAQEYVMDNIELLNEACEEFGTNTETVGEKFLNEEFEWMDVTVRCYLLDQAISEALEEVEDEFNAAHENSEEE